MVVLVEMIALMLRTAFGALRLVVLVLMAATGIRIWVVLAIYIGRQHPMAVAHLMMLGSLSSVQAQREV